jgi:protein-S-isoprenylcysteine O-methyltransferase Ste14
VTIRTAGGRVETNKPTTTIVSNGPYRFTRNPIYIGMFLGQCGLAVGFNSLWILAMLLPFYLGDFEQKLNRVPWTAAV